MGIVNQDYSIRCMWKNVGSIIFAVRMVPREQHLATMSALYLIMKELSLKLTEPAILLVGEHYTSEFIDRLFLQFRQEFKFLWVTGKFKAGEASVVVLDQIRFNYPYAASQSAGLVVFLDDDCLPTVKQMLSVITGVGFRTGCIGLQETHYGDIKKMRGQPSFDQFCTAVPLWAVAKMASNKKFMNLLSLLNTGGELFAMDWFFRRTCGVMFNVVDSPIIHLFRPDKYKLWNALAQDSNKGVIGQSMYEQVNSCSSIDELRDLFIKLGRLGVVDE